MHGVSQEKMQFVMQRAQKMKRQQGSLIKLYRLAKLPEIDNDSDS